MASPVVIVGSGPSGVSTAFALAEAGLPILILDGGRRRQARPPRGRSFHEIRRTDTNQWREFLGSNLEAFRGDHPPSPKFDAPASRFAFEEFSESQRIHGEEFAIVGSLAQGGLSNIWGAGISVYDDDDLALFPLTPADLEASYRRIAGRMGITGFGADDLASDLDLDIGGLPPLKRARNAEYLLERYQRHRSAVRAMGFRLGASRAAVLSVAHAGRRPCALCDLCVWGCGEDAIWSASHDLEILRRLPNVRHRPGVTVERMARDGSGYRLVTLNEAGSEEIICASTVVLAAGTLVTTRLVLDLHERARESVSLTGTPAVGFGLLIPRRLGSALSMNEYSMAQLSFMTDGEGVRPSDRCYGSLFPASGIPASLVISHMPLSVPAAASLYRHLQPALLLGNCFLPGHYTRNWARLERDASGHAHLMVRGGFTEDLPGRLNRLQRQLTRSFRRLGAFVIPGSFRMVGPGEDLRYSGTLPMRAAPGPGEVDHFGELHGTPGLHIVDLSIFPTMPAKHHVFTLMANADRIGRALAERLRASA